MQTLFVFIWCDHNLARGELFWIGSAGKARFENFNAGKAQIRTGKARLDKFSAAKAQIRTGKARLDKFSAGKASFRWMV